MIKGCKGILRIHIVKYLGEFNLLIILILTLLNHKAEKQVILAIIHATKPFLQAS
jgi:hypothetical protein